MACSLFQPTRPLRGATTRRCCCCWGSWYFNPRAPCGARPARCAVSAAISRISTHAPLAGRDRESAALPLGTFSISTHAPLAGRDQRAPQHRYLFLTFQPTRPLRGATPPRTYETCFWIFQPTRPLRGATPGAGRPGGLLRISTHAPLAGRDPGPWPPALTSNQFQPTRPLRGATTEAEVAMAAEWIFQPTRPLRGATRAPPCHSARFQFQPTRPLRGATRDRGAQGDHAGISTHAPLAGRDYYALFIKGRTEEISTHAPLAGRDRYSGSFRRFSRYISTHAPLAGRDSKSVQITMHIFAITDKFQMLLHRMPPVRAFCSFLMQENHADFGCEPPK